jgi:hypothetical protein
MEADMLQISKGTKTKIEVIQSSIVKYKDVFIKANREAAKLDAVLTASLIPSFIHQIFFPSDLEKKRRLQSISILLALFSVMRRPTFLSVANVET